MVFDPDNSAYDKRWTQQGITFGPPNRIFLMHAPSTQTIWMAAVAKNIDDKDIPPGGEFPAQLPVFEPDATWIIDKYRDAFRYGTLGYLMMQPAKPYSNPKLGAFNWQATSPSAAGRAPMSFTPTSTAASAGCIRRATPRRPARAGPRWFTRSNTSSSRARLTAPTSRW